MTEPEKWIIRTHDRGNFKACRQKWDFSSPLRQNLEPKGVSEYLTFGADIHAGLDVWYDPAWQGRGPSSTLQLVRDNDAVAEFHKEWAERKDDRLSIMSWEEYEWLGVNMLRNYFNYARKNDKFKPVRSEVEFEVPIPVPNHMLKNLTLDREGFDVTVDGSYLLYKRLPVVYQGRVDLLGEDRFGLIIIDHKTAARFEDSTAHLEMDEQVASYAWALREIGLTVHSVMYNELKKAVPDEPKLLKSGNGLSKDKTNATTPELYRQALAKHGWSDVGYTDHLAWLEANPPSLFRRTIIRKSSKELDIIGERILLEAMDMLGEPSIYPSPSKNYNCVKCDFRQPCLALNDGSNVEIILKRGYRERVPN